MGAFYRFLFDIDQKLPLCPYAAQGFLGNAQVRSHHAQRNAVVNVVVELAEMVVFFSGRGKAHRSYPFDDLAKQGTHRQACVTLHFGKIIK